MNSKSLSKEDIDSDYIREIVFDKEIFSKCFVNLDRIHKIPKTNTWELWSHIQINEPPTNVGDLKAHVAEQLNLLEQFYGLIENKGNFNLFVNFYFPKDTANQNRVFSYNHKNKQIHEKSLGAFAEEFREKNRLAGGSWEPRAPLSEETLLQNRKNDSAFSLSQSFLDGDLTYGFNFDVVALKNDKIFLVEFLKCEENQKVDPFTSHPNKYFSKNKQKFISLFSFAKAIEQDFFCVNYAKENTKHEDKVKIFKVMSVDENNITEPVFTPSEDCLATTKRRANSYFKNKIQDPVFENPRVNRWKRAGRAF